MPELPEIETLKLQFSTILIGLKIKDIQVFKPKSFTGDKKLVTGEKIIGVRRFAKILIIDLDNGISLAIHLKMSGQLIYQKKNQLRYGGRHSRVENSYVSKSLTEDLSLKKLPNKHTRVIITFTNADRLFFNDQRIFGWIRVISNNKQQITDNKLNTLESLIKNLGPEPLKDLTIEKFREILKSSKRPIKIVLMDQGKIAGVGNIYANDALFLSGIHPKTPANQISKIRSENLYHKLLKVLREGIKWRGSSQNHFRDAYGRMGEKQKHFYVYDKLGEKCISDCGGLIQRFALGGRGTFYCSTCQC